MNSKWMLLSSMILCAVRVLPSRAVELIKDGHAGASIVLPPETEYEIALKGDEATAAQYKAVGDEEVLAAQELQEILEKISGAKLAIVRASAIPKTPAIVLGAKLARANGLSTSINKLQQDGLLCMAKGNALYLSGKRARGTLYAAYEFLESLGCRWVMPGSFGEIYPTIKAINATINKTENPSHSQRYWWCTYGNTPEYGRWTLRNKGNFIKAPGDPNIEQGHALASPLQWARTQEKYRIPVPGKENEWTLPDEFLSIVDGKPSWQNPNFSNPKVWDIYAEYYINFFKEHPQQKYVSISAEDGPVTDERPASRALDSNEYDWISGMDSSTDKLWYFHNQVIERVAKAFPDRKFGVLVYANNMMPPKKSHVNRNMALVFAPLTICPLHHVRDPKCKTNRTYSVWLQEWMKQAREAGAETYYYDYEPIGFSWNVAMISPRWGIIGKNYPWFHQMGLDGHTTQGHDDWASCGLDNYLMQRLYWDANLDYKAVIRDYARARFGKAGPKMEEYYAIYEKRMNEIPDLYSNEVWANHLILTAQVRKAAREVLLQAAPLADTPRAKAQMETMLALQRSTDAMCDAIEVADGEGDFGKAAQMTEPVFAVRDQLNAIYPKFMNPSRVNKEDRNQFLTSGMYLQFVEFDKKIKSAAASTVLPRVWKGRLDTDKGALEKELYEPGASEAGLDELDTTVMPDVKYKTQREPEAFFYRTEVDVPSTFKGKKTSLYFSSIIANELQIWVNGTPVSFEQDGKQSTTWNGPKFFWVNYDHQQEFDITPYIKPGQKNTLAFRVFKQRDFGGTYRRIFLLGK